ncbi:MAG TPA: NAD(P)-dependent oxidoreductase, partial [Ignavibacteria bacterium]|nr:NAD(P)-dependent oxidoreductase [Ignavibacteria bacterium]
HLAGLSSNTDSMVEQGKYYDANVKGTRKLIEAAIKCKIKKLVFASSIEVYGDSSKVVSEQTPTDPIDFLGSTKVICEEMLQFRHNTSRLSSVSLRYANVIGGRASKDQIFSKLFNSIIKNMPINIQRNENQLLNLIYVKDIAHANVNAMIMPVAHQPINIIGETLTIRQIYNTIKEAINSEFNKANFSLNYKSAKKGFDIDGKKATMVLNYKPQYDTRNAINEIWMIQKQYMK